MEALEAAFKPPEEQSEVNTYDQTNSTNVDASEFDQNLREASKKNKNSDIETNWWRGNSNSIIKKMIIECS